MTTSLTLSADQLAQLIERGALYVVIDDLIIELTEELRSGDRRPWREIVLAVARRVPEASL